jgi:hypothetical protein
MTEASRRAVEETIEQSPDGKSPRALGEDDAALRERAQNDTPCVACRVLSPRRRRYPQERFSTEQNAA